MRRLVPKADGRSWSAPQIFLLAMCLAASLAFTNSNANSRAQGPPPSGNLEMTGDSGTLHPIDDPTHDPSPIRVPEEQAYYVFSTGQHTPGEPEVGGIFVRKSHGTLAGPWESIGAIDIPEWTQAYNHNHLWAPYIVRTGGTYWLYYSASSWGTQNSAIGVMSTTGSPGDLDGWVDHGPVVTSQRAAPRSPYNAIDPAVFKAEGTWWIAFGSYQQGIFMYELEDMTTITGDPIHLAARPGPGQPNRANVEGPDIFYRDGYYYLLLSQGVAVNPGYHMTIARSESVTGPYLNQHGEDVRQASAKLLLRGYEGQDGVGGGEVLFDRGRHYLVHHYYTWDRETYPNDPEQISMQVRELQWDDDGWPYILGHRYDE